VSNVHEKRCERYSTQAHTVEVGVSGTTNRIGGVFRVASANVRVQHLEGRVVRTETNAHSRALDGDNHRSTMFLICVECERGCGVERRGEGTSGEGRKGKGR
jgi:hypothetical protein